MHQTNNSSTKLYAIVVNHALNKFKHIRIRTKCTKCKTIIDVDSNKNQLEVISQIINDHEVWCEHCVEKVGVLVVCKNPTNIIQSYKLYTKTNKHATFMIRLPVTGIGRHGYLLLSSNNAFGADSKYNISQDNHAYEDEEDKINEIHSGLRETTLAHKIFSAYRL
ncbi:hypothetical protein [Desulfolutivibrio sp.]|uniref:hypothetical protein n=1 Tax=Desulfolutivibrio sp. TaxID=2773296 RepID=UPI002F9682F3